MFVGFNHVGLVVEDVDEMLKKLEVMFGAKEYMRKEFPEAGQVSCMVSIGTGEMELMAPLGEGVVKKYLETHGPGIHHISMRTNDFENDCKQLEDAGIKVFGRALSPLGQKAAFAHPKTTGGVLYEILEVK